MKSANSAKSTSVAVDNQALDLAFQALNSFDRGSDRGALVALDQACTAALKDAQLRESLELRLVRALLTVVPSMAKDYICRQLSCLGSAVAVEALAPLLLDAQLSHLARFALERIPGSAATAALRAIAPRLQGLDKAGVLNSLGVRRDTKSIALFKACLRDSDPRMAAAATAALGHLGSRRAAALLRQQLSVAPPHLRNATADACLTCAERLSAEGGRQAAAVLCRELTQTDLPAHFRKAAQRYHS